LDNKKTLTAYEGIHAFDPKRDRPSEGLAKREASEISKEL
jgi:hypothetical protein